MTGRLESSGLSILLLNPLEEIILKEPVLEWRQTTKYRVIVEQELDGLHLHREEFVEETR